MGEISIFPLIALSDISIVTAGSRHWIKDWDVSKKDPVAGPWSVQSRREDS